MHYLKKVKPAMKLQQTGFSLIELLVGLVIGLFATLAIMQVFSVFEGQKRTTSGSADAQTNGVIALMTLQRSVQMAGYGLSMPMADPGHNPLNCINFADVSLDPGVEPDPLIPDDEGTPGTPANIRLSPIEITDGGANGSDQILVRYSTSAKGAVPISITQFTDDSDITLNVRNVIGCGAEMSEDAYNAIYPEDRPNVVLITRGQECGMAFVAEQPTQATNIDEEDTIKLVSVPAAFDGLLTTEWAEAKLTCMANWGNHTFDVNADMELQRNGGAIVSGVVALQAQYGVSATAADNNVTEWVDATEEWEEPSVTDRNRIKAIRVGMVLRNGLKEKEIVTQTLDNGTSPIAMDISGLGLDEWQRYRYRVVGTTIPMRNMLWSKDAL